MKETDIQLWEKWNRERTPMALEALLNQLNPLIQREVNRWVGTLARPALEIEAKRLAIEAIQSFSPTAGASLATHVVNRLKKLSRLAYTHQNIARVPEYQTLRFHSFNAAKTNLQDQLGREPTVDELADELGWPKSHVENFQRLFRREYIESGETVPIFDQRSDVGGLVDFVFHDLSPLQKQIFQYSTGYGGAPQLSNTEIMKKLKLTQGQLSYQKRLVIDKIKGVMGNIKP